MHRLEHRVRVQVAELARVPPDLPELGDGGGRRELPGDRPAGIAADHAEAALERELIDLDHHPVDLELQRAAAPLPGLALAHHRLLGVELLDVRVHREAVRAQPLQRIPVGLEVEPLADADRVAPQRQGAVGGQLGVQLADSARRGVARVHEGRQPGLGTPFVEGCEVRQRHVDLAADLQQRRRIVGVQAKRDRADRAQVVGDVLTDLAVAASGAALEHPVAVDQRDRQPVDLRLGDELEVRVLDPLAGQVVSHPLDPRLQLLGRARVGQRQHRLGVADLDQVRDRLAADPLRGRVRRDQLGMLGLDRPQLVQQRVVDVVADLRIVEHVVPVAVVLELLAQLVGARRRI